MSLDWPLGVGGSAEARPNGRTAPWTVIALSGEIDLTTAPALFEAIRDAGSGGGVVVDFAGVDFVDVAAIDALVRARRRLRSDGAPGLVIRSPTRPLTFMLDLYGLLDMIECTGAGDRGRSGGQPLRAWRARDAAGEGGVARGRCEGCDYAADHRTGPHAESPRHWPRVSAVTTTERRPAVHTLWRRAPGRRLRLVGGPRGTWLADNCPTASRSPTERCRGHMDALYVLAYLLLGSRGKPLVSGVVLCAGRRSH